MRVETAFELVFAGAVLVSAAALAAAAAERAGTRLILGASAAIGAGATAAWIAFALRPETTLAVSATGLVACLLASLGALALGRGLARGRSIERDLALM